MKEKLKVSFDDFGVLVNRGVKITRVELKDVRLPVQLQRAMAAEAESLREAKAKLIAAEGEQKSAKALKEAAEIMGKCVQESRLLEE